MQKLKELHFLNLNFLIIYVILLYFLQNILHLENLFLETTASGAPIESEPGADGAGVLAQNTLEMSGVQIVEEMVNMIVAQRAYESNAKAVTTSDSMLETANQLKR